MVYVGPLVKLEVVTGVSRGGVWLVVGLLLKPGWVELEGFLPKGCYVQEYNWGGEQVISVWRDFI